MKNHLLIFILLLLAGCVAMLPEQIAAKKAMEANAAREVICVKGVDCEMKWGRAINWIKRESKWEIQTQTDNVIKTLEQDSHDKFHPGFIVVKVGVGNERFQITMDPVWNSVCDCSGDPLTFKASFNTFVLGNIK